MKTHVMEMPQIMYGTAWKKEKTVELLSKAIRCGFRGVDTACQPRHYREDLVGKALEGLYQDNVIKREEVFI
jgi:diketogulonate reductase-like aldo/keto reductase